MTTPQVDVADNPEHQRYEVHLNGALAGFAAYRREPGVTIFTHTEIDPAFEGHGLGSRLARGALDDVRTRGEQVVPLCAFIASFLERHREYVDLVAEPHRERFT